MTNHEAVMIIREVLWEFKNELDQKNRQAVRVINAMKAIDQLADLVIGGFNDDVLS